MAGQSGLIHRIGLNRRSQQYVSPPAQCLFRRQNAAGYFISRFDEQLPGLQRYQFTLPLGQKKLHLPVRYFADATGDNQHRTLGIGSGGKRRLLRPTHNRRDHFRQSGAADPERRLPGCGNRLGNRAHVRFGRCIK